MIQARMAMSKSMEIDHRSDVFRGRDVLAIVPARNPMFGLLELKMDWPFGIIPTYKNPFG